MKMPHLFLGLLLCVFGLAMFSDRPVPTVETPERIEITYWEKWTGFEGEAMRKTVELFNSKRIRNAKGQAIYCKFVNTTQIDRKLLTAVAGGHPPDLAGFWSFNTTSFIEKNALRPLDELIARDRFDSSRYIDVFWNACRYKGQTWCLPSAPASIALHWNKEMFEKAGLDPERPPRTLRELEEFSEKLTVRDADGRIVQTGFLPAEPGWYNWAWGYFFGGQLNDGPEKITANDPRNIEAFTWTTSFAKKYGSAVTAFRQGFGTFDSPQNAFLSGKVAMVIQGVWMANFIRFHKPHMRWGCAPFPASFDCAGAPVTVAEMDVLIIPRGSKHPDEAWEVMKFINSQEGMQYFCGDKANSGGQGKFTPFTEHDPEWLAQHPHPYLQVFIDLAKSKGAVAPPPLAIWDEYKSELQTAFERCWLLQVTPEEALNDVQERMQAKLDQVLAVQRLRERN
jgi:ABC-type glycerol-3-phosphate transport system substrate-binding protein